MRCEYEAITRALAYSKPVSEALPSWIDAAQWQALLQLADAFDAARIVWMAVGGLAGNLWGSSWPLHDLDFDVPTAQLPQIASRWAAHVFWQGRYVDDEFDIALVRMRLGDVEIDISGADDAFGFTPSGVRTPLPNMLQQRVLRPLARRRVPCQRLSDLIAYKTVIGRAADLAELAHLRA